MDPLSQQLVHYKDVPSATGNASLPACTEWNDYNQNTNSFGKTYLCPSRLRASVTTANTDANHLQRGFRLMVHLRLHYQ